MKKSSVRDLPLEGKRVLLRVDFNVPMDPEGRITDDTRIRASLPTIEYILSHGASIVLMSHLGRPKKKDPHLSLAPCAKRLSALLKRPVMMAPDSVGPLVEKKVEAMEKGDLIMLENLRFYEGEENPEKDPSFVSALSRLGDVYVNDAFGTAHRAHASTCVIAKYFPGKSAAGFLMEKEIEQLSYLLENPERPFYAILGGSKVSTKVGVIKHLLDRLDALFLGGAMAFTFLKAQGIEIGASLFEEEEIKIAREILAKKQKIFLPIDFVIADQINETAIKKVALASEGIPAGWIGVDIGPQTVKSWSKELMNAKTVFWNGPLGVFEVAPFAKGTHEIALALSHSSAKVTVGGGDSVAAIHQMGLEKKFAHLSTGGGASLEFLEFGHLPGIDALS